MTIRKIPLVILFTVLAASAWSAAFATVHARVPVDVAGLSASSTPGRILVAFTAAELGVTQGIQQSLQKQHAAGLAQDKKRFRNRKTGIDRHMMKRQKALDDVMRDRFK